MSICGQCDGRGLQVQQRGDRRIFSDRARRDELRAGNGGGNSKKKYEPECGAGVSAAAHKVDETGEIKL